MGSQDAILNRPQRYDFFKFVCSSLTTKLNCSRALANCCWAFPCAFFEASSPLLTWDITFMNTDFLHSLIIGHRAHTHQTKQYKTATSVLVGINIFILIILLLCKKFILFLLHHHYCKTSHKADTTQFYTERKILLFYILQKIVTTQRVSDQDMFTFIEPFLTEHGLATLFVLSFLAATLVPLGSEWLLVLLLQQGGYQPTTLIIIAGIGNYLGSCTNYFIGLYGSEFFVKRILRINDYEVARAKHFYARYGVWSLFFSWLPIIGDPLCVIGGMFKIRLSVFSALVLSGKLTRYTIVSLVTLQLLSTN